jgi:Tfp pilus assembly PilM family ATPase/Tfp pilus assembly protein PilN
MITTAVEISKKYIKVVQLTAAGAEVKVTSCVLKEYPPADNAAAAQALQQALKEHNIKTKNVFLSIPRQYVTTKSLRLPSQDPREINEMAGFQAVKQIPYPREEIIYGPYVVGVDPEGYSKVILTICHRDVIEGPLAVLRDCGLLPARVTLSSFGLLNWFNLNDGLKKRSEGSPVILVECDTDSSDITVIHKERLIYTRGLTFGAGEEGYVERLTEEINKTLPIYEKETEAGRPAEAFFTGNITEVERSKDLLESSLNMRVECAGSFSHLPLDVPDASWPYISQASFSSVAGSSLGPAGADLLPGDLKILREAKTRKKEFTVSGALLAAVIIALSLVLWNKIHHKAEVLKTLESKLSAIAPEAQKIEKMRMAADVIKSQLSKKSEALDVLNELHKIVPSQIYLSMYNYDEGKVELKGTTGVLSDVFRLVTILENSPYFQNVQVRYATKRKIGEQEFVDFEIVCPLSANPAEKR